MFGSQAWITTKGRADRNNAPDANLNRGQVNLNQNNRSNDNWNNRFRPAAV